MREVRASEMKEHIAELLDEVERGETLIITRDGRAVARMTPEASRRQGEIDEAIASIRALRKTTERVTVEELLSARDEGVRLMDDA